MAARVLETVDARVVAAMAVRSTPASHCCPDRPGMRMVRRPNSAGNSAKTPKANDAHAAQPMTTSTAYSSAPSGSGLSGVRANAAMAGSGLPPR